MEHNNSNTSTSKNSSKSSYLGGFTFLPGRKSRKNARRPHLGVGTHHCSCVWCTARADCQPISEESAAWAKCWMVIGWWISHSWSDIGDQAEEVKQPHSKHFSRDSQYQNRLKNKAIIAIRKTEIDAVVRAMKCLKTIVVLFHLGKL